MGVKELGHLVLYVHDVKRSAAFYRDALGFEVSQDVALYGMRWITMGPPGQNTHIVLAPPAADPGITDEERRMIAEMMAKGTWGHLILATRDVGGGRLVASVADPDGNVLGILQDR